MLILFLPVWIMFLSNYKKYDKIVDILFIFYSLLPAGWELFNGCVLTTLEADISNTPLEQRTSFVYQYFGWLFTPILKIIGVEPTYKNVDQLFIVIHIIIFIMMFRKLYKRKS